MIKSSYVLTLGQKDGKTACCLDHPNVVRRLLRPLLKRSLLLLQEVYQAVTVLPPAAAKATGTPVDGLAEAPVDGVGSGKLLPDRPTLGNTWDEEEWEAALSGRPELADAVWLVTNLNMGVYTRVYLGNNSFGALATGMHWLPAIASEPRVQRLVGLVKLNAGAETRSN
jgi:hypothetical protein